MLSAGKIRYPRKSSGVTLIELMITVAIFGILLAFATRSFSQWIANSKVRTTAEAIQNGLMLAKAEALRRNSKVQFVLTAGTPIVDNVNSITAATSGRAWMVRVYQPGGSYTSGDFIQGRSSAEGSTNVTVSAGQSNFIFTGVGALSPIPGAAVNINVTGANATRTLRVTVSPGGAIRMCDTGLSIATSTMGC